MALPKSIKQDIVVEVAIPDDHYMLEGISLHNKRVPREKATTVPLFTVSEVAKFFFGRSPHWIRWLEDGGKFTFPNGETVGASRTEQGARSYDLADVEKMAHALAENKAIDQRQLLSALVLIKTCADLYGHFIEEEIDGGE